MYRHFLLLSLLVLAPVPLALGQEKKSLLPEISLELPTADQLFRLQSEGALRQEISSAASKVLFPADAHPEPKLVCFSDTPGGTALVPSSKVCFMTLYFQDVRTERELRSCGILEPARSAFLFYAKGLAFPALVLCTPPRRYQCWDYFHVVQR